MTVTRERAVGIALARAGGGTATQVEGEFEHGRFEWKVRVMTGGTRFDLRVDAETGAVTRVDIDRRDDNRRDDNQPTDDRGHGQDDPPGDDRGGSNSGSNSGPGGGADDSGQH